MKRVALSALSLVLFATPAFAGVTKEDLKKLISAGLSEDVILTYVRTKGPVDPLSPDDLIDLKKSGASDKILQEVLGRKSEPSVTPAPQNPTLVQPAPQNQPAPEPPRSETRIVERTVVVEKPVYIPSTTYIVEPSPTVVYSRGYSSIWCSSHACYDSCYPRYVPSYSYACAPRYYAPVCRPAYSFSYSRGRRCGSWSIGFGW